MTRDLLLGFDFGGTKLAVVLAGLDGTERATVVLRTRAQLGAEQAVAKAIDAAHEMVAVHGARVAAVGVATMGITHEDHVEIAPNVPGWDRLALPAAMRAAFGPAPVAIANDVKAGALAEQTWGELHGIGTGLYLNLGTGVAAALIVHGRIVEGAHGAAGEIGYFVRSRTEGPGALDGRAPLEEYIGGAGTTERARSLGVANGVADLVGRTDAAARAFLADLYDEIAWHATNVAITLDPELVVLGGGYTRTSARLLELLEARLTRYVPYPPEVRLARYGADAASVGAIALALGALGSVAS